MRKSMTIRMDPEVLAAARSRARSDNRTVTNYIETVLRRDLNLPQSDDTVEIWAPDDIRQYEIVREPGESGERYEARKRLFSAILDKGGY